MDDQTFEKFIQGQCEESDKKQKLQQCHEDIKDFCEEEYARAKYKEVFLQGKDSLKKFIQWKCDEFDKQNETVTKFLLPDKSGASKTFHAQAPGMFGVVASGSEATMDTEDDSILGHLANLEAVLLDFDDECDTIGSSCNSAVQSGSCIPSRETEMNTMATNHNIMVNEHKSMVTQHQAAMAKADATIVAQKAAMDKHITGAAELKALHKESMQKLDSATRLISSQGAQISKLAQEAMGYKKKMNSAIKVGRRALSMHD